MTHELPKTYSPAEFEDRIYQTWCEKGYFTPDPAKVLANSTFYLGADGHDPAAKTEPRVLGDFAAYSDVRSAAEIAQSYKNGINVNDAELLRDTLCDGGFTGSAGTVKGDSDLTIVFHGDVPLR